MTNAQKGMFAAFFGNFIFGLSFLFSSTAFSTAQNALSGSKAFAGADVPVVLSIRFVFALVLMTLLIPLLKIKISFKGKPVWKLFLLGLFQPVIYFIGESFGLKMTGIVISSVLISLVPIMCQVLSAIFLKDCPNFLQIIFSVISVAGVILITIISSEDAGAKTYIGGILCLAVAVLSAAAFNVLGRSISVTFTPYERTYFMFIVSAVFFSVYALIAVKGDASLIAKPLVSGNFIMSILYLGGLSSVVAYFMINYANTYLPIARATIFSNIITVVSTTAGFIVGETFRISTVICCIVIIAGVWGVQHFASPVIEKNTNSDNDKQ